MKRLLLVLMMLLVASAASAQIQVRRSDTSAARTYTVEFGTGDAINSISDPIPSCMGGLKVYFTQATAAEVTLYPADDDDDTVAEVEANTAIKVFAGTDSTGVVFPTKKNVRFVVDTAETSGTSQAKVMCSNIARGSSTTVVNVADYGPAADGVTDDSAVFNQASAALAAAGGGTLYIPAGDYCLGETGANRAYSGLRITSDDTFVQGAGQERTILRPCGDNGNYAVAFCKDATNSSCAGDAADIQNIGLSDLTIKDEDTCGDSGHVNFAVMTQSDLSGGTPAAEQFVTWDGGSSNGVVYCYQASTGNIGIHVNVGSLAASDSLSGPGWTATADAVTTTTTEESHGVIFRNVVGGYMERVTIDGPADEGVDCNSCTDMHISDIRGLNTPRHLSGGAIIGIGAGSAGVRIDSVDLNGGESSSISGGVSGILTIATNVTPSPINGVTVSNCRIYDTDTGVDQADAAVVIASNSEDIEGVLITNCSITLDAAHPKDAIITSGAGQLVELAVTNSEVNGSVLGTAQHTVSFTNVIATNENDNGVPYVGIDTITGGSYGGSSGTAIYQSNANGVVITGTKFAGSTGDCIVLNSDFNIVTGVFCDTCGGGPGDHCVVELSGADYNSVTGNVFENNNAGTGIIVESGTSGTGCTSGQGANSLCDDNIVEN